MMELLESFKTWFADNSINLVVGLLILLGGHYVARFVGFVVKASLKRAQLDEALLSFVATVTYSLVFVCAIIAALSKLGISTNSLVAVLGAATLAIGLSLQASLSNLAAGVILVIVRPFKAGHFVDIAGSAGLVQSIHLLMTKLKTPDNRIIQIPNGSVISSPIINFSEMDTRRIDLTIGVSYSDDLKKVRKVLEDIVAADERILKDPAVQIAVAELADSSVNFVLRPWVNIADYWDVRFDLIEAVKTRFDEEGISIPFPQKDVHIFQEK